MNKYDVIFSTLFLRNPKLNSTWIEYHSNLGVDHFYLYCLNNLITEEMLEPIKPYSDIVTIINWELPTLEDPTLKYIDIAQFNYTAAMTVSYGNIANWVGHISPDEFLVLRKDNNIRDLIKRFNDKRYIKIKWNWAKLDGMTIDEYENFQLSYFFKYNSFIKKNQGPWGNPFSTGSDKFLYKNDLSPIHLEVHNPIELPIWDHGSLESTEYGHVDESIASLFHYKMRIDLPRKLTDKLVPWAKYDNISEDKIIIDNTIRELIKGNNNDQMV
jgi:hypothetical protein